MLSNVEHVSIESAALAKHRLHHRAVLSKAFDVRMPSHVRRFCQISRHLTAPSNHLVCLLAPLDHIGSHWPGVATEAAGCSTSVPLRTRPSRWMTLLHFARLFFEVIVKRATYTATWRLVRSDE